ncbi:hypothetical protein [Flavobacterium sp.]
MFFIQKSAATTYYVNDADSKGDIYTTALGSDTNDGITVSSPKLTIAAAYQNAKDGDTIIIDCGSYTDLSQKGELLFMATKKITFIIAGISDKVYSKIPLTKKNNAAPAEFYIENDKPIDRNTYLQKLQNGELKKPH